MIVIHFNVGCKGRWHGKNKQPHDDVVWFFLLGFMLPLPLDVGQENGVTIYFKILLTACNTKSR
jgi:hypothetical protein